MYEAFKLLVYEALSLVYEALSLVYEAGGQAVSSASCLRLREPLCR
jgi:hypothetical protein